MNKGIRILVAVAVVVAIGAGAWFYLTRGRESTDDAQVDAHVTPIAARVGGTVLRVPVGDNQQVDAGAVLVELDRRDYEIALDKARADLADAIAGATAAAVNVPITTTTSAGNVATARGGVEEAQADFSEALQGVDAAKARLTTAQARLREQEANATRAARDV